MSGASFWFMFKNSQLNGLKCAFKLPRLHLEGKLESHSYPWDQAGTVLVTALKWKKNVRLVFPSVICTQPLGCTCTSSSCGREDPTNPLQSTGCSQSVSALDGSSLLCSRHLKGLFQFLLKSEEDFLSKATL